ncbi:MAG: site-specific integrase [Burkholderiales bacterium]|nr:site-specific integrase [Burkholderiales bacterium]
MKIKFTTKSIADMTCTNSHGRQFVRDTECRGLCVEVRSSGGKTYYLTYRDERGNQRTHKLANAQDVTPQQARVLCERARSRIAMGTDVAVEREQIRTAPTVAEFFNDSYLPYIKSYKRSWSTDDSVFRNHVLPVIGTQYIDAVTGEHIATLVAKANTKLKHSTTNKLIVLTRYMFNLAIRWRTAGVVTNPTAAQQLKKLTNHRERFLSAAETQTLLAAVNLSPNRVLKYIIPFLLLTGARKREVLDARWCDMDAARSFWRIPFTKSGRERHVPLSAAALQLLASVPKRARCDYIFANPRTCKPYVSIFCSWHTARTAAGLADVRIHDLRHSFASFLVNAGCSLYEVQRILGHASVTMTQRYSHLSQESLLRAASHASVYVTPTAAAHSTPQTIAAMPVTATSRAN